MGLIDFEVMGPYAVALLMSLGALCIFVWGVLAGAFNDVDEEAIRHFRAKPDKKFVDGQAARPSS